MCQRIAVAITAALWLARAQAPSNDTGSLRFEVASVKPSRPGGTVGGIHPAQGGERYLANNAPLKMFITTAYRMKAGQVVGGPGWIDSDLFDMEAKAEKPSSIEDLHTMLKNLIAERFHLQLHYETKDLPVYVLTVDSGGAKLTPHEAQNAGGPSIVPSSEKPLHRKMKMTAVTMDYFAYGLGTFMDRSVIDQTGIKGGYDFALAYTMDLPPGVSESAIVNGAPLDTSGPTIFEALRQQLGLRLEPRKGPVRIIVIDHVEKPSEN
jgi:uncharacterized protein (TIGR03435 family)